MKLSSKKVRIITIAILAAVVVATITIFVIPPQKVELSTVTVMPMNLTQAVTATGAVAGDENVDLAFDTAGTVAAVNVNVGDTVTQGTVLGSLSSDILAANLESANANIIAAQAQLTQLQQGNRPEAVAVYQQKVTDARTALGTTIHDAYLKVQDALNNHSDVLFNNPQTINPTINIFTANNTVQTNINYERLVLGEKLATFGAIPVNDTSSTTQSIASDTLNYAKQFFTDLTAITNYLSVGNSGLSQAQISSDESLVNTAANESNAAQTEYSAALNGYNDATNALTLEAAGGTPQDIATQQAKVAAAQAQADLIQSQINHTAIKAPFTGIISAVNLKVGQVATPGVPAFSLITKGLKVEVQVPESDISKITASDTAAITLDAYGASTTFPAIVSEIDPAETVVNGINSYKVTLQFINEDPRIRSGMTANVSIITGQVTNALAVPSPAIITRGTQTFVMFKNPNGTFKQQPVQTGITSEDGYTEIISGLNQGDIIASFGNQAIQ